MIWGALLPYLGSCPCLRASSTACASERVTRPSSLRLSARRGYRTQHERAPRRPTFGQPASAHFCARHACFARRPPHAMRARHALLWAAHVDARGARLGARGASIAIGVCPALGAVPVVCMACHVLLLVRRRHRRSGGDEARRHRQGEERLRGWRVEGCGAGDGARVRGSKAGTAAAAADGQGARCGARRLAGPRCTVCTAAE